MTEKIIAHVDMDAFFASIEQRDDPLLVGKPVVVGADPKKGKGRGVVSACSYEARRYGIHSAMPISEAYRTCPQAVFLPVRMAHYSEISHQIFSILDHFTPDVEPVSVDEAFLDLSGTTALHGTPVEAARKIKARIHHELQLTASIGIAPVKMVAKIASAFCKPDGLLEIKKENILDFLWPLDIDKLWGVGPKTKDFLNEQKIFTIGDLARIDQGKLYDMLGEHGLSLYALAHGIDDRDVEESQEAKSVSHEHTFEQDTADKDMLLKILLVLSEKVSRRLRLDDLKGRTISIKVRLEGFKTYTRAITIAEPTNFVDDIFANVKNLFEGLYPPTQDTTGLPVEKRENGVIGASADVRPFSERRINPAKLPPPQADGAKKDYMQEGTRPLVEGLHISGSKVRLLGVKVTGFTSQYIQESLFEDKKKDKNERVHKAVDLIKDKFGEKSIHRAR
jgi:nucleotidyltransferase/DNA polymerase involved in DNA repair